MPRNDLAELFASTLDRIPLPDGREYRLMHFSTFGQSEDVKKRVEAVALEIGEGLVHLLETHSYTISHPSDPVEDLPTGKRIAVLRCAHCHQDMGRLTIDDTDVVTLHPTALTHLAEMDHRCA
jgi:hypothetical protein